MQAHGHHRLQRRSRCGCRRVQPAVRPVAAAGGRRHQPAARHRPAAGHLDPGLVRERRPGPNCVQRADLCRTGSRSRAFRVLARRARRTAGPGGGAAGRAGGWSRGLDGGTQEARAEVRSTAYGPGEHRCRPARDRRPVRSGNAGSGHRRTRPGPAGTPSRTGGDLLCSLPDDDIADKRTTVLVPEFLLRSGVGCDSTTRVRRMAEYPVDVPGLSPTFVRVRWPGTERDKDARDNAVERFHTWLTGKGAAAKNGAKASASAVRGGLAVFGNDGFRSASDPHKPLGNGADPSADNGVVFSSFGALDNPGPLAAPAVPAAMTAALKGYREANGPGRVLFLLDSSGSMGSLWEAPAAPPASSPSPSPGSASRTSTASGRSPPSRAARACTAKSCSSASTGARRHRAPSPPRPRSRTWKPIPTRRWSRPWTT